MSDWPNLKLQLRLKNNRHSTLIRIEVCKLKEQD